MIKENKKIAESKRIIKLEKEKIKEEKKNIQKKKFAEFKKTRLGRLFDLKNYSLEKLFLSIVIVLVIGMFLCYLIISALFGFRNIFKLSKDLSKFYDVYDVVTDEYYKDVDKSLLIDKAINGLVSGIGDVYTNYSDVGDANTFNQNVSGVYEGIGCTIQQLEDKVVVYDVYEESPADKAGMQVNDVIVSVDGKDANEMGIEKIANYIKNEVTGIVKINAIRNNEEKTFELERKKVEIPAVTSESYTINNKKIGYINISIFSMVSVKQFEKELKKLEDDGIDGLVIDVRDNNGGYLESVSDISSMFLPKNSVIYQIQKGNKKETIKDKTSTKRNYPIAMLTNSYSASASEILAGAIKESYNGYVVGTKTYGKGTVQQVKKLKDGSMIKYTIENWLTPNGNWVDGKGIEPTHEVILSENYYENPTVEHDNQLQKAIEILSK